MSSSGTWHFELRASVDDAMLPPCIYSSTAYQKLFASVEGKDLLYVVGRSAEYGEVVLPIATTRLGEGILEATSVYGYGGVMSRDSSIAPLTEEFCIALRDFLGRNGIASLFIRHAPFLSNADLLPDSWKEFNRTTYVVALNPANDLDAYCSNVDQKLRWSIRYAIRNGLSCNFASYPEWDQLKLARFYEIYRSLMLKKETNDFYVFSQAFFEEHGLRFGNNCELAVVSGRDPENILAGALFLKDPSGFVHYHLSATAGEAMKLQATELLMASAIVRYGSQGMRFLHLGGGHSSDGSDGLSRFKRKFATEERAFYVSRIICDSTSYELERCRLPMEKPSYFNISEARGMRRINS